MRIHFEYAIAEGVVELNNKVSTGWRLDRELHCREGSSVDRFLVLRVTERDDA